MANECTRLNQNHRSRAFGFWLLAFGFGFGLGFGFGFGFQIRCAFICDGGAQSPFRPYGGLLWSWPK
ncbi:hypothetical protein DZC31_11410 [Stenotrophomonas rhizophila]|nr:hypothetical protein DZC31_11410 [Stenotrophomonas rhizophila]